MLKSSRFKGVCWDAEFNKWRAYGYIGKQRFSLGRHDDEDLAGQIAAEFRASHTPSSEEWRERHLGQPVVSQPVYETGKQIWLSGKHGRGWFTTVDEDDFDRLLSLGPWHLSYGYASCKRGELSLRMHRVVLGLHSRDGQQVDHINRDRLDNRKSNLQLTTHTLNAHNIESRTRRGASTYRGVFWNSRLNKWYAQCCVGGVSYWLGLHETEAEAASAAAAFRTWAVPNSPEWNARFQSAYASPEEVAEIVQRARQPKEVLV